MSWHITIPKPAILADRKTLATLPPDQPEPAKCTFQEFIRFWLAQADDWTKNDENAECFERLCEEVLDLEEGDPWLMDDDDRSKLFKVVTEFKFNPAVKVFIMPHIRAITGARKIKKEELADLQKKLEDNRAARSVDDAAPKLEAGDQPS